MERLEIPGVGLSSEDALAAHGLNAKLLQRGLDRLGVNLLSSIVNRTVSTATTAWTKLGDFQVSTVTSGGLIAVLANIPLAALTSTHGTLIKLAVDDEDKIISYLYGSTGVGANVPLMWVGELPAGRHTFKLYAQATVDTSTIGEADIDSTMYVVELMRG